MRLTRLIAHNYQALHSVDVDLAAAKVHLFCGHNEAGKSTIAEAIRFALTGDSPRAKFKKDYAELLLTHGTTKGLVRLEFEVNGKAAVLERTVQDGALTHPVSIDGAAMSVAIAAGAQRFMALSADERRRFVFSACGITFSREQVTAKLAERGILPELIGEYVPMIYDGFDAAYKAATGRLRELKGQWRQLTGDNWGSEKAKAWEPEPLELDIGDDDVEGLRKDVEHADEVLQAATRRLGRLEHAHRQGEIDYEKFQKGGKQRAEIPELQAGIERDNGLLAQSKAELKEIETGLDGVKAELMRHELSAGAMSCPKCGTALRLSKGVLEDVTAAKDMPQSYVDELRQKQSRFERRKDAANASIDRLQRALQDARLRLAQASGIPEQPPTRVSKADLDTARAEAVMAKDTRAARAEELAAATEAQGKRMYRDRLARDGVALRDRIDAHLELEKALAPDGIPDEMLRTALGALNQRLKVSARLAAWPQVELTTDITLQRVASAEPYASLSASAQWRVDAMFADAVARQLGVDFLVLDQLDILQPSARAPALRWMKGLAYATVIAMATLKERPEVEEGIAVHWIEGGVVK